MAYVLVIYMYLIKLDSLLSSGTEPEGVVTEHVQHCAPLT